MGTYCESLLKTNVPSPTIVHTDSPSIKEDLGHIGDTDLSARPDDSGVLPSNPLSDVEILKGQSWSNVRHILPIFDLGLREIGNNLGNLTRPLFNHDGESSSIRTRATARAESLVLLLHRLTESKAIELEGLGVGMITNKLACKANLFNR